MWESQGKNTFWFFLVKSGIMAFSFSLNQVISRNDFGAQLHKQVSQHNGGQPQAEGRMSRKRGPALTSSGVKNKDEEWCTVERSPTTPYNVEPLNSLKFLFLPLKIQYQTLALIFWQLDYRSLSEKREGESSSVWYFPISYAKNRNFQTASKNAGQIHLSPAYHDSWNRVVFSFL